MNNYIVFSPYYSGLSNVIMSYELAFSISHITGRTLVLPPNCFLLFLSGEDKDNFVDIWSIFDKDYVDKYCNCINFYDVPEFQGKYHLFGNKKSYTNDISKVIEDVTEIKFKSIVDLNKDNVSVTESHTVITASEYQDYDFDEFCQGREVLNLSEIKSKFIHFENNLFGHYWYHVYPGNFEKRNIMKKQINKIFKYKKIFDNFGLIISSKIGPYNSAHIRRNDFLYCREKEIETISTNSKILSKLKQYFDTSIPLYIATDEVSRDFFDLVEKEFKVYFFEDVSNYIQSNISQLEKTILEQIICSKSEKFYGTYLSTYSSRINIIRGLSGKQSDDFVGLNFISDKIDESLINPWKYRAYKKWEWCDSSHPQWKIEQDGKYIN